MKFATWPIVFPISIFSAITALPEIIWFLVTNCGPAEITELSKQKLVEWATTLERRLDSMIEINPPECLDVLEPPRDDVKRIREALTRVDIDKSQLSITSRQIAESYADGKGEPINQVLVLALHVERWCDDEDAG